MDLNYTSNSLEETRKIAYELCKKLNKEDVIVLSGDLGSGKTAFMYGVAEYYNIENDICSPTFTLVNEYDAKENIKIFHFDVYRLADSDEFIEIGGLDYFNQGICFIEWGKIINDVLPKNTIFVDIARNPEDIENSRTLHIYGGEK